MKIAFMVDRGRDIGMGHLTRSQALMKVLKKRGHRCFFLRGRTFRSTDRLVVDVLSLPDVRILQPFNKRRIPVILVGNYRDVPAWSDVCVNVYAPSRLRSTRTRLVSDPAYTILDGVFACARKKTAPRGTGRRILIFAGGGNTRGMVFRILEAFKGVPGVSLDVLIGSFFTHRTRLKRVLAGLGVSARLWSGLSPNHVAGLMASVDLGIFSYGRSLDEARCLGLPVLLLSSSELNRIGSVAAEKKGGAFYLGDFRKVPVPALRRAALDLLADAPRRRSMGRKGRRLIDGQGSGRTARLIEKAVCVS